MEALWLEDLNLRMRDDIPIPGLYKNEALIRVRLAGVCSTDLELMRGYYPFSGIPGHEFVGEVQAVNSDHEEDQGWVGRRVAGEINLSCGECSACRRGDMTHCEQRRVLGIRGHNGAFASYLSLPLRNLHPIPDTLPDEAAVFSEPLAAALEIQSQVHISPEASVLVIGAGRLGQLVAQTLQLTGCQLSVVARHVRQRELLAERGINIVFEDDISTRQADIVVDTTGSPDGFRQARAAVRPRGMIVMKSTYHGDISLDLSTLVVDEITLVGSRCGPFPPAISLMEQKLVNPLGLIDARYPLSAAIEALHYAAQPGVMKVLLELPIS